MIYRLGVVLNRMRNLDSVINLCLWPEILVVLIPIWGLPWKAKSPASDEIFFFFLFRRNNPCLKPLVTQSEKVVNFTYHLLIECKSKIRSRKARPPTLLCFSWMVEKSASASSVRQIAQLLDGRPRLSCLLIIQYKCQATTGPCLIHSIFYRVLRPLNMLWSEWDRPIE